MKKRFTEEQVVAILREGESEQKTVAEICRKHGVSEPDKRLRDAAPRARDLSR